MYNWWLPNQPKLTVDKEPTEACSIATCVNTVEKLSEAWCDTGQRCLHTHVKLM